MISSVIVALLFLLHNSVLAKPSVIFRLDDVQAWWCEAQVKATVDNFLQVGVPVNVGMIGEFLPDSANMVAYLQGLTWNPLVEFVSHSLLHESYASQTVPWQVNDLNTANNIFQSVTGVRPKSFIPPFNEYSNNLFEALQQSGMTIMSAECAWHPAGTSEYGTPVYCADGSDVVAPYINEGGIYRLPAGAVLGGTEYWTNYHAPASFEAALGWINAQIGKNFM